MEYQCAAFRCEYETDDEDEIIAHLAQHRQEREDRRSRAIDEARS